MSFYDDDSGYAMDDPKNPSFFERYVEWADSARKAELEERHSAEFQREREDADTPEAASEDEAA